MIFTHINTTLKPSRPCGWFSSYTARAVSPLPPFLSGLSTTTFAYSPRQPLNKKAFSLLSMFLSRPTHSTLTMSGLQTHGPFTSGLLNTILSSLLTYYY